MRYFFDTEFMEDGVTIDLLSIGIVAQDGRELYLENQEADLNKANDWVRENVFSSMNWKTGESRKTIALHVRQFVCEVEPGSLVSFDKPPTKPEFWAYYADYDWVVLCQLFGTMMDLPEGWPMYCRDFKQWLDTQGNPQLDKLPENEAHNALADARWLRDAYNKLHE